MIEKVAGLKIKGKCFGDDGSELIFFTSNNQRLSVVYGKNGTGKSTISQGFNNIIDSSNQEIVSSLIDAEKNDIIIHNANEKIFVFNEEYIDKNIKIDADGLGTIVLFGDQVDIQKEIDLHSAKLKTIDKDLEKIIAKKEEYENETSPNSPKRHLMNIKRILQTNGWAERDGKLRGLKTNSQIKADTIHNIYELKPKMSKEELVKQYSEKEEVLIKIQTGAIQLPSLNKVEYKFSEADEKEIIKLLSKKIEEPRLNEREKQILSVIYKCGQARIEEIKDVFQDEITKSCPFCFQEVSQEHKKYIVESINKILNKEVDEHRQLLENVCFPKFEEYSIYEKINKKLVEIIKKQIEDCNTTIYQYKEIIAQKHKNVFIPITTNNLNLHKKIKELNLSLLKLDQELKDYNRVIKKEGKLKEELIEINKEIAYYHIEHQYQDYLKLKKEEEKNNIEYDKLLMEKNDEVKCLEKLNEKKSSVILALHKINNSLEYVFFSKNRLKIELNNQKYYLLSNGKRVKPKDISLGERNIIALCYFFTQILSNQSVNNVYKSEELVIVDDPVSSFDFENKVGIMSLLRYQIDSIIKGNMNSKVIVLSHDFLTMCDLKKIADDADINIGYLELKNKQLIALGIKKFNVYSQGINEVFKYADSQISDSNNTIGNTMRKTVEAFSTFNYKLGISKLSTDQEVLKLLGDKSIYFKNLMYRLVLNGDSHFEERVRSLDDADFYEFISEEEKRKTAKDIICLIYILNPLHITKHITSSKDINTIISWVNNIKTNDSFDFES